MSTFAAIIAAAGQSTRFTGALRKKPFNDLKGRAVWLRSAELFVNRDDVVQTIIVVAPDDLDWFKERYQPNLAFMDFQVVAGGTERANSVHEGLKAVREDVDFVAVHDAARPLLVKSWVDKIFRAATISGAAIPAVPVSSTLKRVTDGSAGSTIQETVSRAGLWAAQTPQVFRRELLLEAYDRRGDFHPTDEAQLVEQLGHPITVVQGSPMNIKITTSDDFVMAEALLDALPREKALRALHPFADEEPRRL